MARKRFAVVAFATTITKLTNNCFPHFYLYDWLLTMMEVFICADNLMLHTQKLLRNKGPQVLDALKAKVNIVHRDASMVPRIYFKQAETPK